MVKRLNKTKMETIKSLRPNSKVMCIGDILSFTENTVYVTSPDGILIDDDGSHRSVLSEEDDYFFSKFKYVDGQDLANAKLITEEYADQVSNRWISVDDRLPEDGEFYLTCYAKNDYYACEVGQIYTRRDVSKCFVNHEESAINPTHWMPLPSPPADALINSLNKSE